MTAAGFGVYNGRSPTELVFLHSLDISKLEAAKALLGGAYYSVGGAVNSANITITRIRNADAC